MKFRKRYVKTLEPVIIEAIQFTEEMAREICPLPDGIILGHRSMGPPPDYQLYGYRFGEMNVNIGDWIITGVKGEVYSCKPDIFEMTYEAVVEVRGGEAEVGDEERERLIKAVQNSFPCLDHFDLDTDKFIHDDTKDKLIALIRQPRRTASQVRLEKLAEKILIYFFGEADDSGKEAVIGFLEKEFSELGYKVTEKK